VTTGNRAPKRRSLRKTYPRPVRSLKRFRSWLRVARTNAVRASWKSKPDSKRVSSKQADQIDVRGVVQLACAHLAHGKHDHSPAPVSASSSVMPGRFAAFDLRLALPVSAAWGRGHRPKPSMHGSRPPATSALPDRQPRHYARVRLPWTQVACKLAGPHRLGAVESQVGLATAGSSNAVRPPVGFLFITLK